ncbi:MAG: glycoside hydrolase family 13 protein, partial [Anaerolineae bacterium]|nr:glycoside hydrolase family 13 protein [Anaerolineae bacterium]
MNEIKYYSTVGFLYPYDIRYDAGDRAFCNPLPDGAVQFRLLTQHGFTAATLVYNDGAVHGAPMRVAAQDRRFLYWETTIRPARPTLSYSFALKTHTDHVVYFCKHGIDHAVEPLDRWQLDMARFQPFSTPAWMDGAVVYQIFPERFANGDPTNDPPGTVPWGSPPRWLEFQGGDLHGIATRLDYLHDLGVDVIYVNPINTSPSTHKFDAADFYHVDPAFGGDAALHELVAALHARDMRLIVDASFNHCHPSFFAFQDVLHHGPDSPYSDWFTIYEYPIVVRYRPHAAPDVADHMQRQYIAWLHDFQALTGIPLEPVPGEGPLVEPTYLAWYGVLDMPKLNQRNPETRAYFLDVAAHWLREFDIDGWRMDVARHIEPDFWTDFRRVTKAVKPECFLLAEIWGNTAPWLQGDQFDATMNYIFRDMCVDYFARADMDTPTFLDGLTRMLFLYAPQVTAVSHNLLSSHDVERFLHVAGEDVRRLRLATLLQLTLPGAPGIYYGDEIGMSGANDPDCRRAFPWHAPETWDQEMLETTRTLTRLRRAHPALRHGSWRAVWVGNDAFAFERRTEGERILVLINRGPSLQQLTLPLHTQTAAVLWGDATAAVEEETLVVHNVPAWDGLILAV